MTEQHEADPEGPDTRAESGTETESDTDQGRSEQERAAAEVEDQAASLRRRGAAARPQAENPADVAPDEAPAQ